MISGYITGSPAKSNLNLFWSAGLASSPDYGALAGSRGREAGATERVGGESHPNRPVLVRRTSTPAGNIRMGSVALADLRNDVRVEQCCAACIDPAGMCAS